MRSVPGRRTVKEDVVCRHAAAGDAHCRRLAALRGGNVPSRAGPERSVGDRRPMLRQRRGRSSSTRAASLYELRAVGRWGPGERGDRGGDFFGCRRAVNADAAVRAHLPTQHKWALAAATGTLEPRLTPRTEDELGLDPLLANRARIV